MVLDERRLLIESISNPFIPFLVDFEQEVDDEMVSILNPNHIKVMVLTVFGFKITLK